MKAERNQKSAEFNRPGSENPAIGSVDRLFEQEVENRPEQIALVYGDAKISYAELNVKSNQIAHYLLKHGFKPETLVALVMERSPDLIAGILGILKAGGAYVPLDPDYPRERLEILLEDTNPLLLLTESSLLERIPANNSKTICVDTLDLGHESSKNPDVETRSDSLAYVMFTSGSTGRPKGVMIEHRSIVRLVKGAEYADFSEENVFLQFAPITFDASTFEIWGALLNGARLAIMPAGVPSLADLGKAIREYGVTTLWLTAGLFHVMVDERIEDLKPVRQLLAGGDVLSVTHVQKVLDELECDLINGYGPTENTTFTCCYTVPRDGNLGKTVPIGKPIASTEIYILDEELNPVPQGETGELYIGGDGLARGYLNRDDLTAERFIENPFAQNSSARLYKTGDLARILRDGNIEFLGRADNQVKIRGFRIELEEIEIALTRHNGVREAAALAIEKEFPAGDKQLAAFVVLDPDIGTEVFSLREHLEATLPEYMVPTNIFPIDAMPLNPNGKVDRAALIGKSCIEPNRGLEFCAPESPTEQKIAQMLEEILNSGQVGTNDNFFDLGANSLQLAGFHNRLQAAFDTDIKIVSLFQNPTVKALSRSLGQKDSDELMNGRLKDRATLQREAFARQKQMRKEGV